MRTASRTFAGVPASVSAARRFAAGLLAEWSAEDAEWTASQLVSELATNAVLHARSDFDLELTFDGVELVISVSDRSALPPVRRHFGEQSTTGRGLTLLTRLSRDWGVVQTRGGKTVWCSVPVDGAAGEVVDLSDFLEAELTDARSDEEAPAGGAVDDRGAAGPHAVAA